MNTVKMIPALFLCFSSIAHAGLELRSTKGVSDEKQIVLTGRDALNLRKVINDYEDAVDTVLKKGASDDDPSMIRSIDCRSADSCVVSIDAEVLTKNDTQDYYSEDFNKVLRSLADDEVVISSHMGRASGEGGVSTLDARFLRLMQEAASQTDVVRSQSFKPASMRNADEVSSKLYEVSFKTGKMNLTCYSSIITGMGLVNFLEESCSIKAIVKVAK